jgi:hypothetical protein
VPFDLSVPTSPRIEAVVARMDRLRRSFPGSEPIEAARLAELEREADVESVAASCRLSGIKVSNEEAAAAFRGSALGTADAEAVQGTIASLHYPLGGHNGLLGPTDLARLNAVVTGAGSGSVEPSPWRVTPLHCEAFDCAGRATGRVIPILPPRMIPEKTEDLLSWFEMEMRAPDRPHVPTIGALALGLMAISPFERANGRTIRTLTRHLLLRAGYAYTPYASIEREMESLREIYYAAFDQAQAGIWSGTAEIEPWLDYFAEVLDRHRARAEAHLGKDGEATDLSPLQAAILIAVREHGTVDAGLLLRTTGANRNTLKDNLRRMVDRGVLERSGQRRTARYRLASMVEKV